LLRVLRLSTGPTLTLDVVEFIHNAYEKNYEIIIA